MSVKGGGQGGRGNKPGSHRKGAAVGSGGQAKRRLEGKGPTPPAEARKGHPAARRAAAAAKKAAAPGAKGKPAPTRTRGPAPAKARGSKPSPDTPETVIGRNPVVEALRAKVPATALYVAHGVDNDERMTEALAVAGKAGIPILEMSRAQLDKMTGGMAAALVRIQAAKGSDATAQLFVLQRVGGSLGTALFVVVLARTASFGTAYATAAALTALTLVPVLALAVEHRRRALDPALLAEPAV